MKNWFILCLFLVTTTYGQSDLATGGRIGSGNNTKDMNKPLSSTSQGRFIKVHAHSTCNEIQTDTKDDDNFRWSQNLSGGASTIAEYPELKENALNKIGYGDSGNTITFRFRGKQIVPESIKTTTKFGNQFNALYDVKKSAIIGRLMAFVEPWNSDRIITIDSRKKIQPIHFAVLYANPDYEKTSVSVTCEYAKGDLPILDKIEKANAIGSMEKALRATENPTVGKSSSSSL